MVKTLFDADLNSCVAIAWQISQDPFVAEAISNGDREALWRKYSRIQKQLRKRTSYKDLKIHFHSPGTRSFLRVWNKTGGDDLSSFRHSITHVQKTRKPLSCFEVGRVGLVLRGIVPILGKRRDLVGSVEAITTTGSVMALLERLGGEQFEAILVMPEEVARTATFLKGNPKVAGYVVAGKVKDKGRLGPLASYLKEGQQRAGGLLFDGIQIKDFSGKEVGKLVLIRDFKKEMAVARKDTFNLLGMVLIGTLLIAGMIFLISKAITKPIASLVQFAQRMKEGDYGARAETKNADEIGKLAEAMNHMAVEVEKREREQREARERIEKQQEELNKRLQEIESLKREVEEKREKLVSHVERISSYVENLAQGDFSQQISLNGRAEELGKLVDSLNRMVTQQKEVLQEVYRAAEEVAQASIQLAEGSSRLAEGASEEAASIEEISSSMEEISSITRNNADGAKESDQMMQETTTVVAKTTDSMKRLSEAIEEMAKASSDSQKIIKTIDEIAFQTNLLALNAAVEAARAGEAGQGFAVVADEVRALAQKSAEAARTTALLIEGLIKKVTEGSDLLKRTEEDFSQVAEYARKVAQIMKEIAASSSEQAHGVEGIKEALEQMEKVTQQVASTAEESASSAEHMRDQAANLKQLVSRFKLQEDLEGKVVRFPS